MDGQLQVPLVVERHRRQLAERVLAVEHPAVGAGEQRVGDVADALVDRTVGLGAGARALNPLPLQVVRDLAAGELPVAGVLHRDVRACDACWPDRGTRCARRSAARRARRASRAAMTALRSSSSGASAWSVAIASLRENIVVSGPAEARISNMVGWSSPKNEGAVHDGPNGKARTARATRHCNPKLMDYPLPLEGRQHGQDQQAPGPVVPHAVGHAFRSHEEIASLISAAGLRAETGLSPRRRTYILSMPACAWSAWACPGSNALSPTSMRGDSKGCSCPSGRAAIWQLRGTRSLPAVPWPGTISDGGDVGRYTPAMQYPRTPAAHPASGPECRSEPESSGLLNLPLSSCNAAAYHL